MARSAYLNVLSFKRSGQRAHAHALLLHSHIQRRFDRDVHRNGDTHLPSSQRARSRNVVALYDASTDGTNPSSSRRTCSSWRLTRARRSATSRTCVTAASAAPGVSLMAGARSRARSVAVSIRRMRCCFNTLEPLAKLLGWRRGALRNSPGEHPFGLDCRLAAGSGGPAAHREVEVGSFDMFPTARWDTGGVTDAPSGAEGPAGCTGYVTRRTSWSAVSASTANMQWHITFAAPRTRTWRPPNSSLSRPLTRSPAVRSL